MSTITKGARTGLSANKLRGNTPQNHGLETYPIASGYATSLYAGDVVKLNATGTLELAANGDTVLGVFNGCIYTGTDGVPVFSGKWPASTTSNFPIKAFVTDNPDTTFIAPANGTVGQVKVGMLYPVVRDGGSDAYERSLSYVRTIAPATGNVDVTAQSADVTALDGVANTNTFTIRTSQTGSATTITTTTGLSLAALLVALNAVPNIKAETITGGFLKLSATDGYSLITANTSGTPLAGLGITAGTVTATAASVDTGMVKVLNVIDPDLNILEVTLTKHLYKS